MIDDLVLALQRRVDRIARWVRLGPTAGIQPRRFLIIQIDGLSNEVFEKALRTRRIPHTAKLIKSGRHSRSPLSVGLPSSTPAFQAAAMYGVRPDIPGFHYYDKRAQRELHFPRPGPRTSSSGAMPTGAAESSRAARATAACSPGGPRTAS